MSRANQLTQAIIEYLIYSGHYAFRTNNGGIYDAKIGGYRTPSKKLHQAGVADILCCMKGGRFLAIEVKTKNDRIKPAQIEFIEAINQKQGIAIVARTIDDVITLLEKLEKN